jgi:serine/threonine-protein kinase
VLHQIGSGALGPVYRAYDPEADRLVAVKWFRLDLPPERVHRLVAKLEHIIAADLSHPSLVHLIAAGIVDVSAYAAQEFVAADSLDTVIRATGRTTTSEALRVATSLAGALDFAAASGLVHGALHPRDVLVSGDDVRLTGIGIAGALDGVSFNAPVRRPYTAPERAAGQQWDHRADVFSLAALIHELLWGRRVTGLGPQASEMLTSIPGTNLERLQRVFGTALAEEPGRRFDSALSFADALRQAVVSREAPVAATRPPAMAPAEPPAPKARAPKESEPAEWLLPLGPPKSKPRFEDETAPLAQFEPEPDLTLTPAAPILEAVADDVEVRSDPDERVVQGSVLFEAHTERVGDMPDDSPLSRGVLPLVFALIVGLAVGFAGGYGVGSNANALGSQGSLSSLGSPGSLGSQGSQGSRESPGSATASPAREFTETALGAPGSQGPPGPPASSDSSAAAETPRAAVARGSIDIRSTPPGARVLVDGRDVGRTPVTAPNIALGAHTLRLVRDGYQPVERRVTVTSDRSAPSVSVQLTPERPAARVAIAPAAGSERTRPAREPAPLPSLSKTSGALFIESRPVGASVLIDGKPSGTTPMLLEGLNAGDHVIHIDASGYRRWTSSVRIVMGERARVAASLER